ncbi:MAG: hypothetical protein AAFV96_12085 [Pseudomonadota bacterium]
MQRDRTGLVERGDEGVDVARAGAVEVDIAAVEPDDVGVEVTDGRLVAQARGGDHARLRIHDERILRAEAELNILAPVDGGNSVVNDLGLVNLTGADLADIGASDPRTMVLIGGGLRYRLTDHAIVGVGGEANVTNREDTIYGFRFIADAVIHF